ncbi:hypothetical protein [Nostoc sp. FACHB-110]|uniref:hypothetical protein n=1 Tax=Nostoc sp. FACHB-110 TaxID=2692834 RepID=UPI00168A07D1|nr:hypothetical protein [Nostoc sp. FACHB-110]MBD2437814.1 hypothetical protein [Nostoc sp. FACHB-110]
MHLAPANGIRGYTNEVRLRGLTQYQGFGTRAGGFCLCSCDFSRLVQDMCQAFLIANWYLCY